MKQDISVVRSRTKVLNVYITQADGTDFSLSSGQKLIFGVKKNLSDNNYVVKKTITGPVQGRSSGAPYVFTINPEDTSSLSVLGTYFYDVGLQYSNGAYYSVIDSSRLNLEGNVTEREVSNNE